MRTSRTTAQVLSTFQAYEDLRVNAINVTRIQSIDVAETEEGDIPFCHLAMLMPFFDLRPNRTGILENGVFQGMAAVLLALEHLNTGNGTIVKEIENLNDRCPIRFTAEIFDSGLSQIVAVDHVIRLVSREPGTERLPAAFIGAARSAVSIPTSTITSLKGYPQISPISTSSNLDDTNSYPLFGRTIPSDAGTAVPAILYLRFELGVKNLAVMYVNDVYGDSYAQGLQLAAEKYAPDMKIQFIDFPFDISPEIVAATVAKVKETNFRYIFGILFSTAHYEAFMTEAYESGIAGTGEHFWMFSDSVSTSIFTQTFEKNSPLHLASLGCTRISARAGIRGNEGYELFLRSMEDMNNAADISLIQSLHPAPPKGFQPVQIAADPDNFFAQSNITVVPFLYDATIALGLAACAATQDKSYFDGFHLFQQFLSSSFHGASGNNTYDPVTGTRLTESAQFSILNIIEEESTATSVRLGYVLTDVFPNGKWEQVVPMTFNDGTTDPPPDLPPVNLEMNYLGWPLRGIGIFMSFALVILCIGFAVWTRKNESMIVVKASQPIFLYTICAGCFFMEATIISSSIDDEIGSQAVSNAFCVISPWFFCIGWILVFSALFAKVRGLNKFFHHPDPSSKIIISNKDILTPLVGLTAISIVILALWTAISPPDFERKISEYNIYGQPIQSSGACKYDDSLPFAICLGIVYSLVLLFAIYQSYQARKVTTEYGEGEYIFLAMLSSLGIAVFGFLLWLIVDDNLGARFVIIACLVFLVNTAVLLIIFVPKVRFKGHHVRDVAKRTFAGSEQKVRLDHGNGVVSITGLELSLKNEESYVEGSDDSTEEDEGIRVLRHPKEIDLLQNELESLKKEYSELRQDRARSADRKT
eukprot:scaffold23584_cov127-Cylindrotheca_fusiformis.AAC.2